MPASKPCRAPHRLENTKAAKAEASASLYRVNAAGKGWGGKRLVASRVSLSIPADKMAELQAAVAHSALIGLPLNRMLTVSWSALGLTDAEAAEATGKLTKHIREALAEKGLGFAYVYVREKEAGEKGSHVHILAHIPMAATKCGLLRRLRVWARLAAGCRYNRHTRRLEGPAYPKGAANTKRIGGKVHVAPDVFAVNLDLTSKYVLKGSDNKREIPAIWAARGGGRIIGKRCGTSQNIGATARKHWQASRH